MKHQEKKYRVNDFSKIIKQLTNSGAIKGESVSSTHFYVKQKSNDVTKLVEYSDRAEIHKLKESEGKFTLEEIIPMKSVDYGLHWLRDKGFAVVDVVEMIDTDYQYKGGIIGLYVINGFLYSVILDFPKESHRAIEKQFEIALAEVINLPYNKYLESIGRNKTIPLST